MRLFSQKAEKETEKLLLNENWKLRDTSETEWIPGTVPGSVYQDYLNAGKMEDPYWRANEEQALELMKRDFEYRTVFDVSGEMLAHDEVILHFDGIDTVADICLNGQTPVSYTHLDVYKRQVIGESAQNDTDGEPDADRAAESVPQAAQSLRKHLHDGENGTGVRIHIVIDEKALGQKNGKTGKDPLGKPVGKQQPGQPSDVKGRTAPKQGIYQPGRNKENVQTLGEETEKP